MYKLALEKIEEPEIKLPTVGGSWRKQGNAWKNIYCFTDLTAKAFNCVDHKLWSNKLWKILKEDGVPDHLTCLLRNPYAGQQATFITQHGETNLSKLGKEKDKYVYCHSVTYITLNARLDESQVEIKISRRNVNILIYADITTLMAESETSGWWTSG